MTATILDEGVDTDLFDALDFKEAVPCDWNSRHRSGPLCESEAEWKMILSCCGMVSLLCQGHVDKTLEKIKQFDMIMCPDCRQIMAPPSTMIASLKRL